MRRIKTWINSWLLSIARKLGGTTFMWFIGGQPPINNKDELQKWILNLLDKGGKSLIAIIPGEIDDGIWFIVRTIVSNDLLWAVIYKEIMSGEPIAITVDNNGKVPRTVRERIRNAIAERRAKWKRDDEAITEKLSDVEAQFIAQAQDEEPESIIAALTVVSLIINVVRLSPTLQALVKKMQARREARRK